MVRSALDPFFNYTSFESDGSNFPGRDAFRIDWNIAGCRNCHEVILHRTGPLAAKAEKRVGGDVDRRGLVRLGGNLHEKLVIGGDGVGKVNVEIAGVALEAVGMLHVEGNGIVAHFDNVPDQVVDADNAAVKRVVAVVICRSGIGDTVHLEGSTADAVGHRTDTGAEEALARRVEIVLDVVVAHHDIDVFAVLVRGENRRHTGPEIGHLHSQVPRLQSV